MEDTEPRVAAIQAAIHRRMSGAQRLLAAMEMSQFVRQLSMSRLRKDHPDWTDDQVKRELARYAFLPGACPETGP